MGHGIERTAHLKSKVRWAVHQKEVHKYFWTFILLKYIVVQKYIHTKKNVHYMYAKTIDKQIDLASN